MHETQSSSADFNLRLNAKQIFWGGFVVGALALATLGFVLSVAGGSNFGNLLKGSLNRNNPSGQAAPSAPGAIPSAAPSPGEPTTGTLPPLTKDDHVRGDLKAPVTLVEYSDFECPFCKRFHPTMLQVMDQYKGKVKWVYRHFPLSFHQNAQKEAEASECANELGGNDAFWKYADKIFERTTSNGTGFALTDLGPLAKEIGLDQSKFQSCLDSGKYAKHVQDNENGGSSAGVTGTPGTIVVDKNGKTQLIPGALPFESVKQVVDAALAGS